MAVISADELLEQADRLVAGDTTRGPTQVDLRRGMSNAYYAAFHTVVVAAADTIAGTRRQGDPHHRLITQSVDHATIRRVCVQLFARSYPPTYARYCSPDDFGLALRGFLDLFPLLQQQRHQADYDSGETYTVEMARGAIDAARIAIPAFWNADPAERRLFLFLILFPPKR